jgi:phosphotransferase system  glucose/maltose/N-acetylglucosamine-specific IIC component
MVCAPQGPVTVTMLPGRWMRLCILFGLHQYLWVHHWREFNGA